MHRSTRALLGQRSEPDPECPGVGTSLAVALIDVTPVFDGNGRRIEYATRQCPVCHRPFTVRVSARSNGGDVVIPAHRAAP